MKKAVVSGAVLLLAAIVCVPYGCNLDQNEVTNPYEQYNAITNIDLTPLFTAIASNVRVLDNATTATGITAAAATGLIPTF